MLNHAYALLESHMRVATISQGLDRKIGYLLPRANNRLVGLVDKQVCPPGLLHDALAWTGVGGEDHGRVRLLDAQAHALQAMVYFERSDLRVTHPHRLPGGELLPAAAFAESALDAGDRQVQKLSEGHERLWRSINGQGDLGYWHHGGDKQRSETSDVIEVSMGYEEVANGL
jgi:hypothetical protein